MAPGDVFGRDPRWPVIQLAGCVAHIAERGAERLPGCLLPPAALDELSGDVVNGRLNFVGFAVLGFRPNELGLRHDAAAPVIERRLVGREHRAVEPVALGPCRFLGPLNGVGFLFANRQPSALSQSAYERSRHTMTPARTAGPSGLSASNNDCPE